MDLKYPKAGLERVKIIKSIVFGIGVIYFMLTPGGGMGNDDL